jgi:hypothetical protein
LTTNTVETIFPQTYPHWVWHVEEEGGTEELLGILGKMAKEQKRIQVGDINWDAVGDEDYYFTLDSGDMLADKDTLQVLADSLNGQRPDLIVTGFSMYSEKNAFAANHIMPPEGNYEDVGELVHMLIENAPVLLSAKGKFFKGSFYKKLLQCKDEAIKDVRYGAQAVQNIQYIDMIQNAASFTRISLLHCSRSEEAPEDSISPLWVSTYGRVHAGMLGYLDKWDMSSSLNNAAIDELWFFLSLDMLDGIMKSGKVSNPMDTIACLLKEPVVGRLNQQQRYILAQQAVMVINGSPSMKSTDPLAYYAHYIGYLAKSFRQDSYRKIDGLLHLLAGLYHGENTHFFGMNWLLDMLQCDPVRFKPLLKVTNPDALQNKYLLRAIVNGDFALVQQLCRQADAPTGKLLLAVNAMPAFDDDDDFLEEKKTAMVAAANDGQHNQALQTGMDILVHNPLDIDTLISLLILTSAMGKKEMAHLFAALIKIFFDDDEEAMQIVNEAAQS